MNHRWSLYRHCEPKGGILAASLLVLCFTALAVVSRTLAIDHQGNTAFWPANAAISVAILVLPRSLGYLTALACFVANLLLNAAMDYPAFQNLLFASLNVGVSFVVAFLMRSLCGATVDLTRFRRLSMFACISFACTAAEAGIGELLLRFQQPGWSFSDWCQWTLCDGLGFLLATPAILLALRNTGQDLACDAGLIERVLLLAGALAIDLVAFSFSGVPLIVMIYPLLILTAFRAGPAWVLGSVLLTSLLASAMTAHGFGPLVLLAHGSRLLKQDMVQPFIVSLFLSAVPANNALGEKNRGARRLRRLRAAIESDATHDALTSLANRKSFRHGLAARARSGSACTILLIDLDYFKEVNDNRGHLAGDELLRVFAGRLADAVDRGSTVARLGGDEFAIILELSFEAGRVEAICREIVALARKPFLLASGTASVSASVGAATLAGCTMDIDEALRQADVALYAAKAAGKNGYRMYDKGLDEAARDDAELEAELRVALAGTGGLAMHYQLKFDRNGQATGVEALLRWRHPRRGMIPPSRFIEIAEATELIHPLGAWALREALDFAQRWPQLTVAVNVSAVQLRNPEFLTATLAAYKAAAPKPGQIELEVTETALIDDASGSAHTISALRDAGLRVALDDFGTGYSSLSHLTRLDIDRLKIDRSFVLGLSDNRRASAIVRNVIELGHAMGLQVTAEGIETEVQRQFLLRAGVDEMQGFLLAVPSEEAALQVNSRVTTFGGAAVTG